MMIANGSNLVLTICPFNQSNNVMVRRHQQLASRAAPSGGIRDVYHCDDAIADGSTAAEETDVDEVRDHTSTRLQPITRRRLKNLTDGGRGRSGNSSTVTGGWNNRILRA
jgi:hypothetical protein